MVLWRGGGTAEKRCEGQTGSDKDGIYLQIWLRWLNPPFVDMKRYAERRPEMHGDCCQSPITTSHMDRTPTHPQLSTNKTCRYTWCVEREMRGNQEISLSLSSSCLYIPPIHTCKRRTACMLGGEGGERKSYNPRILQQITSALGEASKYNWRVLPTWGWWKFNLLTKQTKKWM